MVKELNKAIVKGAIWMSALRITYRFIGFISTIILARILSPEDFGIAAIAMSFYALIEVFSNSGMQTVLIQKKNITEDCYNTAWTINLIINLIASVLLFFSARYVADFYDIADLEYILYTLLLLFILEGIKNINVVDFQKNLTFDKEFKLIIIPKLISFFIIIGLALWLRNFWALVIGNVVWKVIEVINTYLMHKVRPSFSLKKSSEMIFFSKWLVLNNIFAYVNLRMPELIMAKFVAPSSVAMYSIASEISTTGTTEIISNLNRAIYPGYAKVSHDSEKLFNLYESTRKIISYIAIPLGVGLASVAPVMVPILLGEKWVGVVEPLIYLSIGGSILAIKSNIAYIYYALSKPYLVTLELAARAAMFVVLISVLFDTYGVLGIAYAFLISAVASFFISVVIVRRLLDFPVLDQLRIYIAPGLSAIIMSIVVDLYLSSNIENLLFEMIVSVILGVITYVICIMMFWFVNGRKDGPEKTVINYIRAKVF